MRIGEKYHNQAGAKDYWGYLHEDSPLTTIFGVVVQFIVAYPICPVYIAKFCADSYEYLDKSDEQLALCRQPP